MTMKSIFKVTFDIKVAGKWCAASNENGWASHYVLVSGDARDAANVIASDEFKRQYDDLKVTDIKILSVNLVASDVLIGKTTS